MEDISYVRIAEAVDWCIQHSKVRWKRIKPPDVGTLFNFRMGGK